MSSPNRSFDVLIAGAGPAGLASGLYLLRRRPDLAGRVVAFERARHPRFKTCAGGLIPKTMLALDELGLALEVPAVEVRYGCARTELGDVNYPGGDVLCTIVRRDEFDARLARAARAAGLEIIEECRVRDITQLGGVVRVLCDRGDFEARLVIGADGSGSRVRDAIVPRGKDTIGRALMTDLPVDAASAPEFAAGGRYRFDFTCVAAGIRGYAWSFPCMIGGRPHLNVGIYDQMPRESAADGGPKPHLLDALRRSFPELPLADIGRRPGSYKSFPIRWFDARDRFAAGNVILAGDAAGVDPLMGEGISSAFEHGKLAAEAVARYLGGDAQALDHYDATLHRAAVGRKLSKLAFAARRFYGPRRRIYFRLAMLSRSAQSIGVDWYNGARHIDELPVRALVARWARAILFGTPVR